MKIAYVVDTYPQLSETFILNQIRGLMRAGYSIDIYTNRVNRTAMWDESVSDISRGCTIVQHPVMPKNPVPRIIKTLYLVLTGLYTDPITLLKTMNIFKYRAEAYTFRLFYLYLRFRQNPVYDVLHCSHGNYALLVDYLWQMGVVRGKIIASFRGRDISKFVKKKGVAVYHDLFQNGALFLPVCEYFEKLLIEYGCPKEKIKVHRSGIELSKYSPVVHGNGSLQDVICIVSVGRLVEKKGLIYSIKAVEKYARKNPGQNIKYTIIGSGPLCNKLKHYVKRNNLHDVVELVGSMAHSKVIETIRSSNILINCSITANDGDMEGIPNVLKEAMAMELPVISTWHSGIPELVHDGYNGFLVPERNVEGICEKITYIIDNLHRMNEVGNRARATIHKEYDMDLLNKELLRYYKEIVS